MFLLVEVFFYFFFILFGDISVKSGYRLDRLIKIARFRFPSCIAVVLITVGVMLMLQIALLTVYLARLALFLSNCRASNQIIIWESYHWKENSSIKSSVQKGVRILPMIIYLEGKYYDVIWIDLRWVRNLNFKKYIKYCTCIEQWITFKGNESFFTKLK